METILIVDDVPANIKILGELLKKLYKVLVASNAQKAIQIARNELPDLILMDVMMPEMDGFTTCKILKARPETANIPVIFITALTETEDIVKGFESGGQDYITKPLNPPELFARIQTHLELKKSREDLQRYARELESLARTDYLTNLMNRRCMMERMQEEVVRCQRHGNRFSLAIADVDNFKKINDTYGHDCGDQVLKHFAFILKDSIRMTDISSRWGGEEFVLLFPETDIRGAKTVCEKIRGVVAGSSFCYGNQFITITATFGVSEFKAGGTINAMIKSADEALCYGKTAGKNCVVTTGIPGL
ncbi:MAG: diguanylate cyclase [Candidatus Loosdrechtia sp.]|uniref:diguanylate cyclase n=1 Tax=Candidatus Loosdrechtia sp. TaxID=3101272 RepID=UPI003A63869D|nr:MAG: diguanylate cyclase [Candidatus Jettenia sp. AMX2]